jgi:hypothetical protein
MLDRYSILAADKCISGEITQPHGAQSDSDGLAVFDGGDAPVLCGTSAAQALFVAFCEGAVIFLAAEGAESAKTPTLLPVDLAKHAQGLRLDVVEPPPATIIEGAATFENDVIIRVVDPHSGQGVAGKYVVAMQSMAAGAKSFGFMSTFESHRPMTPRTGEHDGGKRLLHPTSSTNGTGFAHFPQLGFASGGHVGAYKLQFLCEGSATDPQLVQVASSVARVTLLALNPTDAFGFAGSDTNIVSPQPVIFVADSNGNGIAGKEVSVFVLSSNESVADRLESTLAKIPEDYSSRASVSWSGPVVTDDAGYARFAGLRLSSASSRLGVRSLSLRFESDGVVSTAGQSITFGGFPAFFSPSADECGRIDLDHGKLPQPSLTAMSARVVTASTIGTIGRGAEVLSWSISAAKWPTIDPLGGLNLSVAFRVYNFVGEAIKASTLRETKKLVRVQAISNTYGHAPDSLKHPMVELLPRSPFPLKNNHLVTIASDGLITIAGLQVIGYPSSFLVRVSVGSIRSNETMSSTVLDIDSLSSSESDGSWYWREECSAGDGLTSEGVLTSTLVLTDHDSPAQAARVEVFYAGSAMSPKVSVTAGEDMPVVTVRVIDQHGRGVPHISSQLFVQDGPAALSALLPGARTNAIMTDTGASTDTIDYCNGTLAVEAAVAAMQVMHIDVASSAPGLCATPPRTTTDLVDARFAGLSAVTNGTGYATFSGMQFASLASGIFAIVGEASGVYSADHSLVFDVRPAVVALKLVKGATCGTSTVTAVGKEISPACLPELLVTTSGGSPLQYQWVAVRAIKAGGGEETGVRTALGKGPLHSESFVPPAGLREGSVLVRSDNTGRVRFEGLLFSGAPSGCFRFIFSQFVAKGEGVSLTTNSSTVWCTRKQVELVEHRSTDSSSFPVVTSGAPMASAVKVAVLMDASSTHSPSGVWCRARIYSGRGAQDQPMLVLGGAFAMTEVQAPTGAATGIATFDALTIDGDGDMNGIGDGDGLAAGRYRIYFECQGVPSSNSLVLTVTEEPAAIAIVKQPPYYGMVVNELYALPTSVRVSIASGAPLPGSVVQAVLVDCRLCSVGARGELLAESAYATTDSNGIATFDELRFQAGASGFFSLRFESVGSTIQSSASDVFYVMNPVDSVTIVRQPFAAETRGRDRKSMRIGTILDRDDQPRVRVNFDNATATAANTETPESGSSAFEGKRVCVEISGGGGARLQYTPPLLDATGTATFTDLRFTRGSTTTYQLIFTVDGVASHPSEGIDAVDPNEADFSQLGLYTDIIWLSFILVPMLIANGTETPHFLSDLLWQSFGLFLCFFCFVFVTESLPTEYYVRRYNKNLLADVLLGVTSVVAYAMVVLYAKLVKGSMWTFLIDFCRRRRRHNEALLITPAEQPGEYPKISGVVKGSSFCRLNAILCGSNHFAETKLLGFKPYVAALLNEGHDQANRVALPSPKVNPRRKTKCCGCCLSLFDNISSVLRDFTLYMKLMLKDLDPTDRTFFFPQRLQLASLLSFCWVLATMLVSHGLALMMKAALYNLEVETAEFEAGAQTFDESVNYVAAPIASLINASSSNASVANISTGYTYDYAASGYGGSGLGLLSNSSATRGAPNASTETENDGALRRPETVDTSNVFALGVVQLRDWQHALEISSITAVVLTMMLVFFVWTDMLSQYKRRMLKIRRGKWTFDRRLFSILNAPNFVGLQVAHMVVGTFLMWFLLTFFLFILVSPTNRGAALDFALTVIISVLGGTFVMRVTSKYLANSFVVDRTSRTPSAEGYGNGFEYILHRHWFAVFDFTWVFLGVINGFFVAAGRLFIAIAGILYRYIRLDTTVATSEQFEHFDSGYGAYMGMLLLDHTLNNPVALIFTQVISDGIEQRKWQQEALVDLKQRKTDATAGATYGDRGVQEQGPGDGAGNTVSHTNPLNLQRESNAPAQDSIDYNTTTTTPACFRWLVAYTLVRNRSLVTDRKMSQNHNGSVPRKLPFQAIVAGDDTASVLADDSTAPSGTAAGQQMASESSIEQILVQVPEGTPGAAQPFPGTALGEAPAPAPAPTVQVAEEERKQLGRRTNAKAAV